MSATARGLRMERRGRRRRRPARREGPPAPGSARMPIRELLLIALQGLCTRRLRAALSALGIAIGIGAMVAVVGASLVLALGCGLLTLLAPVQAPRHAGAQLRQQESPE